MKGIMGRLRSEDHKKEKSPPIQAMMQIQRSGLAQSSSLRFFPKKPMGLVTMALMFSMKAWTNPSRARSFHGISPAEGASAGAGMGCPMAAPHWGQCSPPSGIWSNPQFVHLIIMPP